MKNFELKCKRCGSEDIAIHGYCYEGETGADTIILFCKKCDNEEEKEYDN